MQQYDKFKMPCADQILPGRPEPMEITNEHFVNGNPLKEPFPEGMQAAIFGMGCFWGVERLFWEMDGVFTTAAGYSDGCTENPNYDEVCSGRTGHAEVVLVVYDPAKISYDDLLQAFWENHDPTQGMRQGNDLGTQYRSCIFCFDEEQLEQARKSKETFQRALAEKGLGEITTEVAMANPFYYAEDYHQQYLAKNPEGYCGLAGTGACLIR